MEWMIIDVQGFKNKNNRFIVKEIYVETKNLQFHGIIKSPSYIEKKLDKKHRNESKWLMHNYHGISWKDGYITLDELRQTLGPIINNKSVHIFVKGEEKIKWIKQIMGNETLICKNVENEYFSIQPEEREKCWSCTKHKHIKDSKQIHCAVKNVKILKKWFMLEKMTRQYNQICKNEFSLQLDVEQFTTTTAEPSETHT